MREVVGIFTHKELLEALGFEDPLPRDEDLALQAQVIDVSNRAKRQQKRLDKEFQLAVIDQYLRADLELPLDRRPRRNGTLIGMDKRRVYVAVDGFALDLKVYKEDLELRWRKLGVVAEAEAEETHGRGYDAVQEALRRGIRAGRESSSSRPRQQPARLNPYSHR